ncbi:hypothetical protein BBP40_008538 [Aspergillus hancockii]|nr:hypothetical protein BBP40_008538 [Aspergillus hancockii]
MDPNGPTSDSGLPSPGDIIAQQRKDAIQAAVQPTDGGLFAHLTSNPFFTAGFGLAGLGAGLSFAQKGVRHGAALLRRRMLVDVEISVKDDSYPWFLHWMTLYQQSQLNSARAAASRMRESKSLDLQTGRPWETITLTTLYSHRHIFEELFKEAHAYAARSHEGKTSIYNSWGAEWKLFGQPRRKRPLESVVLDEGVKERIVDDVKDFLSSGKWYHDRGIPYRRGYLLYGPPGTGKSSFIQALAGELDYDIAILNLSERGLTDDRLNHLLTIVPNRTLVLLEDVDAAFSNRRTQTNADGYRGANVTFSGLLNAMDGVASAEERVIFLTTNHVERLDPALVRPGRVDMTVRLGEVTRYQVACLWDRFYSELDTEGKYRRIFLDRLHELGLVENENGQEPDQPKATSAAALQGLFLYNKGNMEGAIAMAEALTYSVHDEAMEHDRPSDN